MAISNSLGHETVPPVLLKLWEYLAIGALKYVQRGVIDGSRENELIESLPVGYGGGILTRVDARDVLAHSPR